MANQETYITTVRLNADEAKNKLSELGKKVDELKSKKEAALKTGDLRLGDDIQKEIKKAENALKQFKMQTMSVEEILNNLPDASIDQIQKAIKSLNNQMRHLPTSSAEFKEFNEQLQLCKSALLKIKSSGEDASPALGNLSSQAKAAAGNFERAQQEAQFLYRIMHNIKGASVNELNASASILQSKMDNVSPQSATYKAYGEQLKVIKDELDLIHGKQKEVNTLISQYDKEIDSAQKDMVTVRRETELVNNTLSHLSSSSVRDIEYSIKIINEQLRGMDRGTAEFKNMTEQAKRLKTELAAVRYEGAAQQSWINRAADWFNKMQGMAIGAVAAVTGLSFTIRKCTEDFADMDDEMTNVQKYTNQTKKEVREMNEDFKKVDTRTSREELNKLAEEAGRLGKTSKKDIEEFVDGADKIKVALGDDLGETSVRDIGKLAMMFGEDKTKGLRGAMYATGSAVNDLAQSSSAGAGYIVDFTARVAGIGMQAGLTQTQIMGLGSVLDQNMQQDEMAATAVSQLINKLFQDTGKMAKVAGLNVKEFSKTLKTDANAALLQFLQAMKSKGGFSALAPMFEDMKLDGQRATSVLSVMANKINDIKDAQTLANKSYQQGTSVLQEFNTQNNSAKAQLEKSQKVFHDLSIELGEKLMPISRYAITTGGTVVKLLSTIIDFVFKYRTTLIALVAGISALIIVEEADIIKKKAIAFWNNIVITGCKKLWAVLLANPYLAAAAAVAVLVAIVVDLTRKNDALSQSQKTINKIQDEAAAKVAEESTEIELLTKRIHDNKLTLDERKDAIIALKRIVPDYTAQLTAEGNVYNENTKALTAYVDKLKEKALVEGSKDALRELSRQYSLQKTEIIKQEKEIKRQQEEFNKNSGMTVIPGNTGFGAARLGEAGSIDIARDKLKSLREEAESTKTTIDDVTKAFGTDIVKSELNSEENTSGGGGGDYVSEAAQKKAEAARRKAEAAQKKAEAAALKRKRDADKSIQAETNASLSENADQYSKGLITYEKYIDKTEEITLDGLRKRKLVWGTESNEYKNLLDDELRATEKHDEAKRKITEKGIERDRLIISNSLQTMFNDKNSSMYGDEDKLNEALYQNDLLALQDRLDLYKEGSEERKNIQSEIEEFEANHEIDNQQRYRERVIQNREQFGREDVALQEKIAINGLETLHKNGLYSEKEYQEMMLNMKSYYASKAAEQSAKLDGAGSKSEKFNTDVDTAINLAKAKAGDAYDPTGKNGTANPYLGQILNYRNTMTQLNSMYAQDKNNYAIAQAAKSKVTGAFLTDMASQAQAAFDSVNSIMSAASNYYAAQSQYEQNVTTKKYDAEIQKAGENTKKGKKLKEQEEKEIAEIKTKYNKKAMDIQIAQAIAQTAINAIAAYGSAMEGVPYPANMVLAPIAAGIALAAGAIQIATIKKQQESEVAGYYEGGFTSGNDYRKKAGIVHQGEFVANHQAVNNPQLMPVFNLLDSAQRRNSVGSLTALDVSRTMGASSGVSQTVVNVPDTSLALSQMAEQQQRNSEALERLNQIIEGGIYSKVIIDGPNGFDKQYKHYQKLLQNK